MNESGLTDSQLRGRKQGADVCESRGIYGDEKAFIERELEFVPANGRMFTIPGKRLCGAKMI